jgi:hypothetical protein
MRGPGSQVRQRDIAAVGSPAARMDLDSDSASAGPGVAVRAHPSHGVQPGAALSATLIPGSRSKRWFRTKSTKRQAKNNSRQY